MYLHIARVNEETRVSPQDGRGEDDTLRRKHGLDRAVAQNRGQRVRMVSRGSLNNQWLRKF